MDELITVDRGDGPAVAGLLTALIHHWNDIPLGVQATMIDHASSAAFDSLGRDGGRYVVTAFVLKHRAALARRAPVHHIARGSRGFVDAARWPLTRWLASFRKVA